MARTLPPALAEASKATQFKPGQGGRPKGARNKLGEAFLEALMTSFNDGGMDAILRVQKDDPSAYVRVISGLLPKEITGENGEALFSGIKVTFVKSGDDSKP